MKAKHQTDNSIQKEATNMTVSHGIQLTTPPFNGCCVIFPDKLISLVQGEINFHGEFTVTKLCYSVDGIEHVVNVNEPPEIILEKYEAYKTAQTGG